MTHDPYNGDAGEHDHVWGPLQRSHLAGTVHRKCQVPTCRYVNAYDDDEEDVCDTCEWTFSVDGLIDGRCHGCWNERHNVCVARAREGLAVSMPRDCGCYRCVKPTTGARA